ncbi:D-alanyl-D-alanine carboxypeptidase family protein [Tepidibacillus marianensis]|uniref:D-alanyl-D-alanine carboxypeptidase family protein n=1 Tax=Tepidibacillus marianensis TaxID=3131995 RepID=UPI0030D07FAC
MKRLVFIILLFIFVLNMQRPVHAMNVAGESAILVDVKTGDILYEKNPDLSMYPASITKIMTVILAIENGDLEDIVTVSRNASTQDGTRIYIEEGENVWLKDLIYGTLLNSGNDAAVAIAEHVGGSVDNFVKMMNEKAQELGMKNTHFVNPNGLPNENHVTSARDMSLLALYAMKNPIFREIAGSKTYEPQWIGNNVHAMIQNHNRLLWEYPYATGMKTGYTVISRSTIVASAKKDGRELVAVVLKSDPRAYFQDAMQLLDYGFDNTTLLPMLKMEEKTATLNGSVIHYIPKEIPYTVMIDGKKPDLTVKTHFNPVKNISLFDRVLVKKGDTIGKLDILNLGVPVKTVDLIATNEVDIPFPTVKIASYSIASFILLLGLPFGLWIRKKQLKRKSERVWWLENDY